jgi:hypothetical protein
LSVIKNRLRAIFLFSASVRLAVPLMLTLAAVVAYGTILESKYNSEYAKIAIYNSTWFLGLLALLFVNILNSTLSRWPWKRRHLGFVITHLGLLTLLTGAFITSIYGIDGQLRVHEGEAGGTLVLPRLMLSYRFENSPRAQSVVFDKSLSEPRDLGFLNDRLGHVMRVARVLPFASLEKSYRASESGGDDVALSFVMRSPFFNVSEWLHSRENPVMQLGPATLRLVKGPARRVTSVAAPKKRVAGATVLVKEIKSGQVVAKWDLQHEVFHWKDLTLALKRKLEHAVVVQNHIEEGDGRAEANPAVELEATSGGEKHREILFAKYPGFSLNKAGLFGYGLEYASSAEAASVSEAPAHGVAGGGHVIEFHADPAQPRQVQVELYKEGQRVAGSVLREGQTYQTPWMGMTIALGTLSWGGEATYKAEPVEPQRGQDLPPSALLISPPEGGEFWLSEGDTHSIEVAGRRAEVTFGRETLDLPFQVHLKKFTKVDYPGTETPLSFESEVEVGGTTQRISMNEPMKRDGYTVYQASYIMNDSGPPDSIFSVNWDPGRPVKYIGSLILAVGIILFTLTRSRWYIRKYGAL